MYRVYVEDFTDLNKVWVVDEGSADTIVRVSGVIIEGVGFTQTNLFADNKKEPKAWIEVNDATLKIVNNVAILRGK